MKTPLILILCLFCFAIAGCAALESLAPPQYNEEGAPIPGSREPTALVKGIADVIPYGETGLAFIMLIWGSAERYRAARYAKGLKATLEAGKKVSKDPATKAAWAKVKEAYKYEHEKSGTSSLINLLLAKLK